MESELSLRQAAFDFFWAQVDQEEEDERALYMESELSLRQAAFDFFWAQVDQEEEDERALYMESELSLRQAALDFFWAQLDQEEEDERACFMESELSLRQAAFDFFWAQVDQEEEDERALYMESELSLRQAALDFFWAQVDEEEKDSKVVRRKVAQSPQLHVDMIAQDAEERPTFSMAGSPAKSIRLAKLSVSLGIDTPFSLLSSPWQPVTRKSSGTKKRSSSTSAMAIDLGDSKAKSGIDYLSGHAQVVSISKEHIPMLSGKKGELPPLKKAKMCVKVPSPHLPRGC